MNEPPEFDSSAIDLAVVENTASNTNIGDPIAATDPESDMLTYSISHTVSDLFDIDSSTGQISIGEATTFDLESPADSDGDNIYDTETAVIPPYSVGCRSQKRTSPPA